MNKKIIATLGPSSFFEDVVKKMDLFGVNIFRINLSHTNINEFKKIINKVKNWTDKTIAPDTEGAQLRTGNIVGESLHLETGSTIINREWDDKGFKFVRERCDMFQRAVWFPTDKAKRDGKNGKEIKIDIEKLDFTKPNLL